MTAEVAIMNKTAVALAADSAVTVGIGEEQKVFQTVNKIFSLSKYHPLGLMVYGNAEFMGIDWETIVKLYRDRIGDRVFCTLRDCADDFLLFLQSDEELFDEASRDSFVEGRIGSEFTSIRDAAIEKINQEIAEVGEATPESIQKHLRSEVASRHRILRDHDDIKLINGESLAPKKRQETRVEYKSLISRLKKMVFEKLPLDASISRRLTEIALWALTKDGFFRRTSGVVVAGYGSREIFPALEEFYVDGVFSNTLRFGRRRSVEVKRENPASIIPFAQSEMVVAFMEGVDPAYQNHINKTLHKILESYSATLLDLVAPESGGTRSRLEKQMTAANEDVAGKFENQMKGYRARDFVLPVVRIVEHLPKSELAAMAESLVNLTSFRRHVTPDAETVSGPIDVAVISRGDGFIWIKRKHYFQPELNQHFQANYYRRTSDAKAELDS